MNKHRIRNIKKKEKEQEGAEIERDHETVLYIKQIGHFVSSIIKQMKHSFL
jgi:hypothetical protein